MNRPVRASKNKRNIYVYFFLICIIFSLYQCKTRGIVSQDPAEKVVDLNSSPVIPPSESIKMMKAEEGFEVKLVASEPLISTPVALLFDHKDRIWVLEMSGYMPDSVGTGEDIPSGKVVILEDTNHDGVADERKIFLDSLVLPRAFCLIENGILVAEPPNLWYYEIINDKPGKRVLVDDKYTGEGNVEHHPNGLLRAMDNWIYNAKSSKRYRKQGDKWIIEQTHFRGQWGISQDNYGRLYYNSNSTNLIGDYFTPGFGSYNKDQRNIAGYNEISVKDNRVYPARPTPGVNRGYMEDILDDSLRLVNFTAACGPVIYRGDLFGAAYNQNAFVAEPTANLIKRNILHESGYIVNGEQAYQAKEFLTSTDERFRPVNLYNGPDGALYVADMYRGIIQHKTYLTPYLKAEIRRRNLTLPLGLGRIYKIVPKNKKIKNVKFPDAADKLVALLGHPNGWVRDKAQQILVDRKDNQSIKALQQSIKEINNPLKVVHALWTLEGLGSLRMEDVLSLLKQKSWPVRVQALSVLPSVITKSSYNQYTLALEQMLSENDELAAPYIAYLTHFIQPFDKVAANRLLQNLTKKYPDNRYVADAIISNLQDREEIYQKEIIQLLPDANLAIHKQLQQVISARQSTLKNQDSKVIAREFPKGAAIFGSACQTCHGPDGNGIKGLAPPLNKSEWVNGNKNKLISIVLFGLSGPVQVNGHLYQAPEINGEMPGIGYSKDYSDEDVTQLLNFIRRSWQNNSDIIDSGNITEVRQKLKGRGKAVTVEELKGM